MPTGGFGYVGVLQIGHLVLSGQTGGTVNLAIGQVENGVIDISGTLTSNLILNFPNDPAYGPPAYMDSNCYEIINGCTGAFSVTVNGPGTTPGVQGAGLVIPQGKTTAARIDGSGNLVLRFTDPANASQQQGQSVNVLADGGTVTPDLSKGQVQEWTIAANTARTLANPINAAAGASMRLIIINGSGGAFTGGLSLGTAYRSPALTVGASTKARVYTFTYDGTSWFLDSATGADV